MTNKNNGVSWKNLTGHRVHTYLGETTKLNKRKKMMETIQKQKEPCENSFTFCKIKIQLFVKLMRPPVLTHGFKKYALAIRNDHKLAKTRRSMEDK